MASRESDDARRDFARWAELVRLTAVIALAWTLSQVAFVIWPQIVSFSPRSFHVSFAVALAWALIGERSKTNLRKGVCAVLALAALMPAIYISLNAHHITAERIPGLDPVTPVAYGLAGLLIVLLFEAGRRFLGWGLTIFVALFIVYFFAGPNLPQMFAHRYTGIERFVDMQFLSLQGLYGVPTGVSVSTVFYFILFAAIYDTFGGGRLIIDFALTLTGKRVGGPGKAAVVASGMLGSVSGSAVANVMSTGIFTIPLMQRAGYSARFAGGIEAAASTGAQLVPPVMGAAAFIMADFLQVPYRDIVLAAILPAIAYYFALLVMVDLEARRRGAPPMEMGDRQSTIDVLRERGHLLLPLAWLIWRIVTGYPVEAAAMEAAGLTIFIGMLRRTTRQRPLDVVKALVLAAERSVTVALPCALAGLVVAVIAFTGLGTKFSSFVVALAGGQMSVLLVLSMLASLVLGAGMPTTSAYIMAAILLAPGLAALGVEPIVAHFFIFYFAILSMVTPPVALAAYAAAAITKASASQTGWTAFGLSIPGFVIPFAAVMHPGLLLVGTTGDTIWALVNVVVGVVAIGVGIIGWLSRPIGWVLRAAFVLTGIVTMLPGLLMSVVALGMLAALTMVAFFSKMFAASARDS
jgi:TRAP transporter 4TM/12TM fusion protein